VERTTPRREPSAESGRAVPERCSSCGSGLVTPIFCFSCDHIQPFSTVPDYFRLFGLPRAYDIDKTALEVAYQRLSFALHPDLQAGAVPPEKRKSERLAADLNDGYRVLSSESARGAYLLELLAKGAKLNTRQLPPGFLQEMFVLQERIDELGGATPAEAKRPPRDDAAGPLRGGVDGRLRETLDERARLFREALAGRGPARSEDLQALQSNLNQENYLRRLLERLATLSPV